MGSNSSSNLTAGLNDTVKVDYVGSLQSGVVFDTSVQAEAQKAHLPQRPSYSPLEFKVGSHMVIPGFENGVVGMKVGETKTVTIPPVEAYGEVQPDLIGSVPRANIQGNITVGINAFRRRQDGKVVSFNDTSVTIDFNHPLAGKTLIFKITLVNVTKH